MRLKSITYDWDGSGPGPSPGDVLETRTGRRYRVVFSRQVRSRVHRSRWALRVAIEPQAQAGRSGRYFPLVWSKRDRR